MLEKNYFYFLISIALGQLSISTQKNLKNEQNIDELPSLLILPGYMGSQLTTSNPSFVIDGFYCPEVQSEQALWANVAEIALIKCFRHKMSLQYNNETDTMESPSQVKIKTASFGSTKSVATLGEMPGGLLVYFQPLFERLKTLGYELDENVKAAPYDFRKMPLEPEFSIFMNNLKILIEQMYNARNKTGLYVVTHSFGSPMFLKFLSFQTREWKDKHLKWWISVCGALGGAGKAAHANTFGYVGNSWILLKGKAEIFKILSTYPASFFLQPSLSLYGEDRVLVKNSSHTWTSRNISLLQSIVTNGTSDKIYKMLNDQDIFTWTDPGVNFYCVYSNEVRTVDVLVVDSNNAIMPQNNSYTDGDGTLTLAELEACKKVAKLNKRKQNKQTIIKGESHSDILKGEALFNVIKNLISS